MEGTGYTRRTFLKTVSLCTVAAFPSVLWAEEEKGKTNMDKTGKTTDDSRNCYLIHKQEISGAFLGLVTVCLGVFLDKSPGILNMSSTYTPLSHPYHTLLWNQAIGGQPDGN